MDKRGPLDSLAQADLVSGMAVEPPGEIKLEQGQLHGSRLRAGQPD